MSTLKEKCHVNSRKSTSVTTEWVQTKIFPWLFYGILQVAHYFSPEITDKNSYLNLYYGVSLWKNKSKADRTWIASATMGTLSIAGQFQAAVSRCGRGSLMCSSLLSYIALSLMFWFSFLLILHIYTCWKASSSFFF